MKYKLLKDYPLHTGGKFASIPAGTVLKFWHDMLISEKGYNTGVRESVAKANPDWFEKIEEPIINLKCDEHFWKISENGEVEERVCGNNTDHSYLMAQLNFGNCFPTRLFTREEVESIAQEVKAVFKKHQNSKL